MARSQVVLVGPGEKFNLRNLELPPGMRLGEPEILVVADSSQRPVPVNVIPIEEQVRWAVRQKMKEFRPCILGFA